MPDDDTTDTERPDDAEGVDDEPPRSMGRIVQLERPRPSRRRRAGAGTGSTRPDRRGSDGAFAGPVAAGEHEPSGLDVGGTAAGRPRAGRRDDAGERAGERSSDDRAADRFHGAEALGEGTGTGGSSAAAGGVTLTTLRGRRWRGRPSGVGRANATEGDGPGADAVAPATAGSAPGGHGGGGDDGDGGDGTGPATGGTPVAVAPLHPRMRSRRIAVRRSEGLRRLRRLTWGLAALALVVDGVALAHTGFVDVDGFDVTGGAHTSAAAIEHASGVHEGDALLTLDESGAERRIEVLPWVAEADVVRQWPGTVRITVTEREPAAVLQVDDDPAAPLALVDAAGRVLEIGAHPEGLIAVTQAPAELTEGERVPAAARDALRIAVAVQQRMPGTIVSLTVGLEATLAGGGVVRLGSIDDLDTKLMALSTVLSSVDLECLGTLELSVADHPALTRSC